MAEFVRLIIALVPVGVAGLVAYFLFSHADLRLPPDDLVTADGPLALLRALVAPGILMISAVLVGGITRWLLLPHTVPGGRPGRQAAPVDGPLRDQLARQVVTTGTIVIGVLATVLIGCIAWTHSDQLTTTGLSIFTAVLPVFATWVGTVLAAYFTN